MDETHTISTNKGNNFGICTNSGGLGPSAFFLFFPLGGVPSLLLPGYGVGGNAFIEDEDGGTIGEEIEIVFERLARGGDGIGERAGLAGISRETF